MTPDRAAMFFDCEGHITVRSRRICFTQSDPTMLLEVQAIWGGHLRQIHSKAKGDYDGRGVKRSRSYRLQLRRAESDRFVAEVGPLSRKIPADW